MRHGWGIVLDSVQAIPHIILEVHIIFQAVDMTKFRMGSQKRSREKQVIAYLHPESVEIIYEVAATNNKTNHEVMADIINAELASMGIDPVSLCVGHQRILRRARKNRASVRENQMTSRSRLGKVSCAGWFDREAVNQLRQISVASKVSIQRMIERGLSRGYGADHGKTIDAAD